MFAISSTNIRTASNEFLIREMSSRAWPLRSLLAAPGFAVQSKISPPLPINKN